ncbi:hypothetical protein RBH29_17570 [Herbivorax sp. ANBcel31]|uniref:hypothetical protein n=1 Tax=Herbivorax sp. ANBcel31 TaxID=3069754 RepID=UPI0027B5682B|nr:hypothetical protein [Herbivorax sp. ANBcel31]MDQ2088236.1 hypothetical protein [Herbivorax sp. ANBcel31]
MVKKLIVLLVCMILICFITSACASNNLEQNDTSKEVNIHKSENYANNKLNIDKSQIQKIYISGFPKRFEDLNITDVNQISSVVDYLISINPVETKLNPKDYSGGGYLIKIQFKDDSERVFNHMGNMFFMEEGKFTYEMKYEEAIKIDSIVANILENNMDKSGMHFIIGTIVSIESESSGHNISCVIKDKDNKYHDIYLKDASIIDSTGNGWMILHNNDEVKIYYSKDNPLENGALSASKVFIKKAAN